MSDFCDEKGLLWNVRVLSRGITSAQSSIFRCKSTLRNMEDELASLIMPEGGAKGDIIDVNSDTMAVNTNTNNRLIGKFEGFRRKHKNGGSNFFYAEEDEYEDDEGEDDEEDDIKILHTIEKSGKENNYYEPIELDAEPLNMSSGGISLEGDTIGNNRRLSKSRKTQVNSRSQNYKEYIFRNHDNNTNNITGELTNLMHAQQRLICQIEKLKVDIGDKTSLIDTCLKDNQFFTCKFKELERDLERLRTDMDKIKIELSTIQQQLLQQHSQMSLRQPASHLPQTENVQELSHNHAQFSQNPADIILQQPRLSNNSLQLQSTRLSHNSTQPQSAKVSHNSAKQHLSPSDQWYARDQTIGDDISAQNVPELNEPCGYSMPAINQQQQQRGFSPYSNTGTGNPESIIRQNDLQNYAVAPNDSSRISIGIKDPSSKTFDHILRRSKLDIDCNVNNCRAAINSSIMHCQSFHLNSSPIHSMATNNNASTIPPYSVSSIIPPGSSVILRDFSSLARQIKGLRRMAESIFRNTCNGTSQQKQQLQQQLHHYHHKQQHQQQQHQNHNLQQKQQTQQSHKKDVMFSAPNSQTTLSMLHSNVTKKSQSSSRVFPINSSSDEEFGEHNLHFENDAEEDGDTTSCCVNTDEQLLTTSRDHSWLVDSRNKSKRSVKEETMHESPSCQHCQYHNTNHNSNTKATKAVVLKAPAETSKKCASVETCQTNRRRSRTANRTPNFLCVRCQQIATSSSLLSVPSRSQL